MPQNPMDADKRRRDGGFVYAARFSNYETNTKRVFGRCASRTASDDASDTSRSVGN